MLYQEKNFHSALPIWAKGRSDEINCTLLFEAKLPKLENAIFKATSNNTYQLYINDIFVFMGPARAAHGFYRVDELNIEKYLVNETNKITILASSYRCNSYYLLNTPGFFCAEVISEGNALIPTGSDAWKIFDYAEKLVKVQRYSFQRPFVEVYRMKNSLSRLSSEGRNMLDKEICPAGKFISREVSLPELPFEAYYKILSSGKLKRKVRSSYYEDRAIENAGTVISGFKESELELQSMRLSEELELTPDTADKEISLPAVISEDSYVTAEMKTNITGLIYLKLSCKSDTTLFLLFDEVLRDGKVDFTRMRCSNTVVYYLEGGKSYELITAEPYGFKYITVASEGGEIELTSLGVIRMDYNASEIIKRLDPNKADDAITRIYNAAVESFRQNVYDIYMDCPSRERAGWLGDPYFTSRVEKLLTGKSTVEHNFLANFAMPDKFDYIPDGMLPMCYPSDHPDGIFIPNFAMWFGIELYEHYKRTGDRDFINEFKNKIYSLLDYFKKFENKNGLLEKLESWVFVEWSRSNDLVQDINYPTNMLYSKFLRVVSELYGDSSLAEKADSLKKVIRKESRHGLFFCDNSVYTENGKAVLSGECTETCQYYAFFSGVATPEEDQELWKTLLDDFGPERAKTGKWNEIHPSNALFGNYLRCDLLAETGELDKLEANIRGYFDYMAIKTGTLWENDGDYASCNHGFASHVLVWLDKLGYII